VPVRSLDPRPDAWRGELTSPSFYIRSFPPEPVCCLVTLPRTTGLRASGTTASTPSKTNPASPSRVNSDSFLFHALIAAPRRLMVLLLHLTLRKLSQNPEPSKLVFLAHSTAVTGGTATSSVSRCHSARERDGKAVWYNPMSVAGTPRRCPRAAETGPEPSHLPE
jgi:hypothetical protein